MGIFYLEWELLTTVFFNAVVVKSTYELSALKAPKAVFLYSPLDLVSQIQIAVQVRT